MAVAKKTKTARGRKQDQVRVAGGRGTRSAIRGEEDRKVGIGGEESPSKRSATTHGATGWPLSRRARLASMLDGAARRARAGGGLVD